MRALVQIAHGDAGSALRIEDHPVPAPRPGEVTVAMEIAPIHRSDIGQLTGSTKAPASPIPRVLGVEGVGIVVEVGRDVDRFKRGDRVFPPKYCGTFTQMVACSAAECFAAPPGVEASQLAILCTMGLTAILVLDDDADLPAGSWIIHNGANSSIGQMVTAIAHARGLRQLAVVRREGFDRKLRDLGADAVVIDCGDGDRLAGDVTNATQGAPIHVGLDLIGGDSAGRMAHALTRPGKLVLYGGSGGEPARIDYLDMGRKELTVVGMGMSRSFNARTAEGRDDVMRRLGSLAASGTLRTDVAAVYTLDQYAEAFAHAARSSQERSGKVLFRLNGG